MMPESGTRVEFPPYVNRLSFRNRLQRLVWRCSCATLFRPSPRFLFVWRVLLLRLFGAKIGRSAKIDPSARIWAPWNLAMGDDCALATEVDCYNVAPVSIGAHVSISQGAFLCTAGHDLSDPQRAMISKPIVIGDGAWIFARAYVGPGVRVGEGAVVAACAVAVKDVEAWTIVGGNPARFLKRRELRR